MKVVIIYFVGLLFAFTSCDVQDVNYGDLDSDLVIDVRETYPGGGVSVPVLTLYLETTEQYPCANFKIVSRTTLRDGHLTMDILGRDITNVCLTAIGPATLSLELAETVDRLTISSNGEVDEYRISIDGSLVAIIPEDTTFSSFTHANYYRYPKNSFAYLCGTTVEDAHICDDFKDHLLANVSLEEFEFPSNGNIPYPDSSSGYWHNAPATYFNYQDPSDLTTAGELLNHYYIAELAGKEGLGLSIIGWNNAYYRNDQQFRKIAP